MRGSKSSIAASYSDMSGFASFSYTHTHTQRERETDRPTGTHTHTYVHKHTRTHTHVHTRTHTYTHTHTHTHTHTRTHTHTHTQVVNTLVSKMIISDELFASWDQPTGSIVMAGNSQQKMYSIGVRIQERFRV